MKKIKIGDKLYVLGKKTLIMGILNVTPDSFYDGGKYLSFNDAVNHAIQMQKEGADIIDIGGESTRPGATTVSLSTELSRVIPLIEELKKKIEIPISIDSYKSEVVEKAVEMGAGMVNNVTALTDDTKLTEIIAKYDVPICLMHMKGTPTTMQVNPNYYDVVEEIKGFFKERISYALSNGIKKENIIIDPGIGFGKRTGKGIEDNCEIIRRLSVFKELDKPILVGASRKSFIGNIFSDNKPLPLSERLEGSLAAACAAVMNGADIVRVHDVKETHRCMDIIDCIVR